MPAATTTQDPTNLTNIKVGDRVALVRNASRNRDRIQGLRTVMKVEETKRGPKVTLTDGTSWDVRCWGQAWGTRTQMYYQGPHICMATSEILEEYRVARAGSDLARAAAHWEDLPADERELLMAAVEAVKELRKAKETTASASEVGE